MVHPFVFFSIFSRKNWPQKKKKKQRWVDKTIRTPSCIPFTYTALCWHDLNTTAELWICSSSLYFVFWGGSPEALRLCFEMYHALFAACFVFLSALYRPRWRVNRRETDKWGRNECSLGAVSLSCSGFNTNMGWKVSSLLHHSNTAKRHNDISIWQKG